MGDSKFSLKVEFRIYGRSFKHDCYLNWTDTGERIDRRIIEMFEGWYDEAYSAHKAELYEAEREEREKTEKEARKNLYIELKKEFED